MSTPILLSEDTEMATPYRGRGKVSLTHIFPKGTSVLYTRNELASGVIHHKIAIRHTDGELYEKHVRSA